MKHDTFGPALPLGMVNVILKIIVITVVTITGQLLVHSLMLMSGITLQKKGSTALVYDSDTSVFKVRHTLARLRMMSGCGGFICILSICLFPAELATDFGVIQRSNCRPEQRNTYGICAAKFDTFGSMTSDLSTTLLVENFFWNKRQLVSNKILQGLHKDCDGTEYFGDGVQRNISLPVVIAGCWARNMRFIKRREAVLTFGPIEEIKGENLCFISVAAPGRSFYGIGAVLNNYKFSSSFLCVRHPESADGSISATVLEYHDSEHLAEITRKAANRTRYQVKSNAPVLAYDVGCQWGSMSSKRFYEAIYLFRFAQLSRPSTRNAIPRKNITTGNIALSAHGFDDRLSSMMQSVAFVNGPVPLDAGDVVKAVISRKISEHVSCQGETFQYTRCGGFNVKLALPLLIVTLCVFIVWGALVYVMARTKGRFDAPVTANQWRRFAIQHCSAEKKHVELGSDEYNTKYRQYGRDDYLGEFLVKKGYVGFYFVVRRILFMKSEHQYEAEHGVYTLRSVLSFADRAHDLSSSVTGYDSTTRMTSTYLRDL